MLNDHAPALKSLCRNTRRGKRKILCLLAFFIAVLFLLSISCLDLNLFREPAVIEAPPPEAAGPETIESEILTVAEEIPEPVIEEKTISVESGDTLIELLVSAGLDRTTASSVIENLKNVFNPRNLRKGQKVTLAFEIPEEGGPLFHSICISLDATRDVRVVRSSDNSLVSSEIFHELDAKPSRAMAEINTNLFSAASEAGMPVDVLIDMIRAYSYDVDFQRDIRRGDKFEAVYEKMLDKDGNFIKGGSILYARLSTNGRILPIYRYRTSDGDIDLFNEEGRSVRKTLMVTPVDGARLSSRYGMRRHPVLGYSRMHRGLDFAAPAGTPIMAAGDGVLEYVGRNGGYGKYIRIRHANEYKTVYGHLSRYARGIKKGIRVKQGQTIGYVGSTGISTGPHLHYEVLHRNMNLNPASVKTPPGRILEGEELERFLLAKKDLENLYASLDEGEKLADI